MSSMKRIRLALLACGMAVAGISGLQAAPTAAHDHAHAHPSEGPHHGSLIELGKEDYHAELVHDHAANSVTIYMLDGSAAKAVPIDAKQLTLNLLVGGRPQQFQLAAQPQANDPEGRCSAFGCTGEAMCKALDAKGTTGRINVEVAGKVYVGRLGGHTHPHPH